MNAENDQALTNNIKRTDTIPTNAADPMHESTKLLRKLSEAFGMSIPLKCTFEFFAMII